MNTTNTTTITTPAITAADMEIGASLSIFFGLFFKPLIFLGIVLCILAFPFVMVKCYWTCLQWDEEAANRTTQGQRVLSSYLSHPVKGMSNERITSLMKALDAKLHQRRGAAVQDVERNARTAIPASRGVTTTTANSSTASKPTTSIADTSTSATETGEDGFVEIEESELLVMK